MAEANDGNRQVLLHKAVAAALSSASLLAGTEASAFATDKSAPHASPHPRPTLPANYKAPPIPNPPYRWADAGHDDLLHADPRIFDIALQARKLRQYDNLLTRQEETMVRNMNGDYHQAIAPLPGAVASQDAAIVNAFSRKICDFGQTDSPAATRLQGALLYEAARMGPEQGMGLIRTVLASCSNARKIRFILEPGGAPVSLNRMLRVGVKSGVEDFDVVPWTQSQVQTLYQGFESLNAEVRPSGRGQGR